MLMIRELERIRDNARQHGTMFEFQLALLLMEADLHQQEVVQNAFPDFVPKFNKTSAQFYVDND